MTAELLPADWRVLAGPDVPVEAPHGIPGLIRARHDADPGALACADEDRSLSRQDLELLSDDMAESLRAAVPAPGPVVVRIPRGVDRAVAFLGVLKAGRAFLPVDPGEPPARVARMAARAAPAAVVGAPGPLSGLPVLAVPREPRGTDPAPLARVPGDQPVYVMFTSGSTGEPKGVEIGSAALCSRLQWMQRRYPLGSGDRVLQKTPYTFDPSVWEVFWPLLSGAQCVFAPDGAHRDPDRLAEFAAGHGITVCHFVPSMLSEFLRAPAAGELTTLRDVFCSGEALSAPLARRALDRWPSARLHNLYGPTEAAIDVTYWDVPAGLAETDRILIGEPVDNTVLVVVDEDGTPAPTGGAGELWIGGSQLAAGYVGREDLTAAAFPVVRGRRWYRTGDRVRETPAGLAYLGRTDGQAKVGGVRVEPLEVEHVLAELPGEAAVVAVPDADTTVLVAVLAGSGGAGPDELRRHAAARLPAAMVPAAWHRIPAFPLGASGKLDRKALTATVRQWWDARRDSGGADPVRDAWTRVLGAEPESGDAGFVGSGGTSLAAIRLVREIRAATGAAVPVGRLLGDLSFAQLTAFVAAAPAAAPRAAGRARTVSPLAPEQRRLWTLSRLHPGSPAYNVGAVVRFSVPVQEKPFAAALDATVRRHDILRARVEIDDAGAPSWRFDPDAKAELEIEPGAEPIEDVARRVLSSPLPEDRAPLFRAVLAGAALVLVFNHLVADQETVDLVLADLADAYTAVLAGRVPLPDPAPSYAEYAAEASRADSASWDEDFRYWRARLADAPPELALPFRRKDPARRGFAGEAVSARLSAESAARLRECLRAHEVTAAGFFLAVFAAVLRSWSGQDTVVVGMPSAHRRSAAEPGLAGFLVDTLPVRLDFGPLETFAELLRHTRTRYTEAMDHAAAPFDAVVAAVRPPQAPGRDRVFQVWFNDLTGAAPVPSFGESAAEAMLAPVHSSLFDLGLYLFNDGGALVLQLVRALDAYPAEVARELVSQCARLAERVVENPGLSLADLPLDDGTPQSVAAEAGPRADIMAEFFEVAAAAPDAVAVVSPDGELTYAELAARARAAAAGLRTVLGECAEPAPVLVRATRDADYLVAIMACWLAGAPAALVDAALPEARLRSCRDLLGPGAVITGATGPAHGAHAVEALIRAGSGRPLATGPQAGASHVLFTSGTTGDPHPVSVPHGPLRDFLGWYLPEFGLGPHDRFALLAGAGHDPVLREIFGALLSGGTLCVPPPAVLAQAGALLAGWLASAGITVLHATPALLELTLRADSADLSRVRLIVSGGAPLTWGLVRRLRAVTGAEIVNAYGTTETPQIASCHRVGLGEGADLPEHAQVPVGTGAGGQLVEVRLPSGRRAAVGQRGEVFVRGGNLADGYFGGAGPEARFAEHDGVRTFRTGDLGRRAPDGSVCLDGRADRQAEVDGHRIELAEIEATALRHPLVREAVAARTVGAIGPMLTLEVTAEEPLEEAGLRAFLRSLLPRYAVPAAIRVAGELGRTPNGKPRPDTAAPPRALSAEAAETFAVIEKTIAAVLGRAIGPDENFFDAGLTSMALVQLHEAGARASSAELPPTVLFAHPNLRALRRFLAGETARPSAAPAAEDGGRTRRIGAARRELRKRIRAESERP